MRPKIDYKNFIDEIIIDCEDEVRVWEEKWNKFVPFVHAGGILSIVLILIGLLMDKPLSIIPACTLMLFGAYKIYRIKNHQNMCRMFLEKYQNSRDTGEWKKFMPEGTFDKVKTDLTSGS